MERVGTCHLSFMICEICFFSSSEVLLLCPCRYQRVQPIIVDAGIYLANRKQFFQASQKRDTPESFKFFTGKESFVCVLDDKAHSYLATCRFAMGYSEQIFHRIQCFRLGQSSSNIAFVLHECNTVPGRLFPFSHVQFP